MAYRMIAKVAVGDGTFRPLRHTLGADSAGEAISDGLSVLEKALKVDNIPESAVSVILFKRIGADDGANVSFGEAKKPSKRPRKH